MERLKVLGHTVGEYVGDGQGEREDTCTDDHTDADQVPEDEDNEAENDDSSDDAHPLLFLYDCETSGLSIYNEHIVEIAAMVVGVPLSSVSSPKYSSLIHTPRNIPKAGK